ncbi:hypothetical protein [Arthrobacter sp. NPDC058127]|uniref:hypothetical protein n=1 Tax=Arthrobacter sp. NPDC058127 TaxID=3346351 RepID=UPI0036E04B96
MITSSTTFGIDTAHPDPDPTDPLALAKEWLPEHEDGHRQLVVQGDVHRVSDEEAASVFQQRSRYLACSPG